MDDITTQMKIEYIVLIIGAALTIGGIVTVGVNAASIYEQSESVFVLIEPNDLPSLASISVPMRLLEGEEFTILVGGIPQDVLLHAIIEDPSKNILFEGAFHDKLSIPILAEQNGEYIFTVGNLGERSVWVTTIATTEEFLEEMDLLVPSLIATTTGFILLAIGIIILIVGIILLFIFRIKKRKISN